MIASAPIATTAIGMPDTLTLFDATGLEPQPGLHFTLPFRSLHYTLPLRQFEFTLVKDNA